jgi:hypothetical protein
MYVPCNTKFYGAQNRACFRSGEIRVLDSTGIIERTVAFSEANRKLWCRDFTATCRDPDPVGDVSKAT